MIIKDISTLINQKVTTFGDHLRLTPNTRFLAIFLASAYAEYVFLNSSKPTIQEKKLTEIVHSCILLASKMRERDIYCPLIPHIIKYSSRLFDNPDDPLITEESIKNEELMIAEFFGWNISFITAYDHLEEMLSLGFVMASDRIQIDAKNYVLGFSNAANLVLPAGKLNTDVLFKMVNRIRKRAVLILQYIASSFITNPCYQLEIAYLAILIARRDCGVLSYDSPFLKELYKIDRIVEEREFSLCVTEIGLDCWCMDEQNLLFDLGVRYYDKDGNEEVLEKKQERRQENRETISQPVIMVQEKKPARYIIDQPMLEKSSLYKPFVSGAALLAKESNLKRENQGTTSFSNHFSTAKHTEDSGSSCRDYSTRQVINGKIYNMLNFQEELLRFKLARKERDLTLKKERFGSNEANQCRGVRINSYPNGPKTEYNMTPLSSDILETINNRNSSEANLLCSPNTPDLIEHITSAMAQAPTSQFQGLQFKSNSGYKLNHSSTGPAIPINEKLNLMAKPSCIGIKKVSIDGRFGPQISNNYN